MVSVTRENIKELLPEIESNISCALFVAIDTEFSGLNLGLEESRESCFDSAENRYRRLRQNVKEASLLQLGITCFFTGHLDGGSEDSEDGQDIVYKTVCYNIILAPSDIGLVEFRPKSLVAEWSAMRFLRSHKFDLNQVVGVGVPYMKAQDIKKFCRQTARGTAVLQDSDIDNDSLRQAESEVLHLQKILDEDAGKTSEFVFRDLKTSPYIIHAVLREAQPEIWTVPLSWNSLKAEVVGPARRAELEQTDRTLEEWIIQESTIGGRIFARLVQEQKAIVGFALLPDILFLIDTFYGPLPESYVDFKILVKDLFPNLYDAKVLAQLMSRHERINTFGHFEAPSLLELYTVLTTPKTSGMFAHAPEFQHDVRHTFYAWESHAHEAAFDAFMAGVVFLYSVFAITADKTAEQRSRNVQSTVRPLEAGREPLHPKRAVRDGSTTCHALPPLVLRELHLDMDAALDHRGILYIHMCADKFLNIFGEDEQANRSKAWVRLTSKNGVSLLDSQIVKAYLEAVVYEHRVNSPNEIVIACTTPDRAVKVAEYAKCTLGVNAEVFDSASIKDSVLAKSKIPTGYGVVLCGALLTTILGFACQTYLRRRL